MKRTSRLRRAAIGLANVAGRAAASAGMPLGCLDEDELISRVTWASGSSGPLPDELRRPFSRLISSLESEAQLTPVGRLTASRDVAALLGARLAVARDRREYPAIALQRIEEPIFILGLPRTGSTLLHHLLAQDPANQVTRAWEVMVPSPPPMRDSERVRARRMRQAARQLRWFDVMAPEFKKIHPLGADRALECIALMSLTFMSPRFYTMFRLPSYERWLDDQDFRPVYAFHRQFLQHLQWRARRGRWVLKAPAHIFTMDALLAVYPDARVVQTHRDPTTVLASVASLHATLRGAFSERIDRAEIGRDVTGRWLDGFARAIELHRSGRVRPDRRVDVYFHELVKDPLAAVRHIYRRFGLELDDVAEARMQRFLDDNRRDKHGRHEYRLADFGVDAGEVDDRCAAYRDYFDVPREEPRDVAKAAAGG